MLRLRTSLPRPEVVTLALAVLVLIFVGYERSRDANAPAALDSYSTYDAASGGYRALYELLAREAVRVERFERRAAFLDATLDTLVYVEPLPFDPRQHAATRADVQALEDWVRGGGRLLYIGFDDAAAKRGVLALPASRAARTRAYVPFVAPALRARGIARIDASSLRRWKPARAAALVADERGPLVVEYPYGRGSVVAVVDQTLFANAGIARADRARLAVALAMPVRARGVVAFDELPHGYVTPEHWWSIVPRPFAIALGLAGVAFLCALAGAALRLGPPLVPAPRDDRTTADFIDAVAGLFERNAASSATVRDAATSTTHALARAVGLDAQASSNEIKQRIERADLRAAFAEMHAIALTAPANDRNLVRAVALAQRLRKEYALYGRSRN